jgi:hypothetical protein
MNRPEQMHGMIYGMGEPEDTHSPHDPRTIFTPQYWAMHSQQYLLPGTPSTVLYISRDQTDSTSENIAIKHSNQEYLTDEQKAGRDNLT